MFDIKFLARSLAGNNLYIKSRRQYHSIRSGRQYCRIKHKIKQNFHVLTSSIRPLPNFIIIGAQKAGTTSLFAYITNHPAVAKSSKKEVRFFDVNFSKGVRWYRHHFPLNAALKEGIIAGEATPGYLYHPHAAKRIASIVPEAKLIVILRNPVDRAISQYWHEIRHGAENLSMQEAFKKEKERLDGERDYGYAHVHFSYLDRGIYITQIARYLNYFDRNQIHILKSEDLFRNTQAVFDKVAKFLKITSYKLPDTKPRNIGKYEKETKAKVREELQEYFQPYNAKLSDLKGLEVEW